MSTQTQLHRTPLHAAHDALGAKMVPFGGWDMPVQYDGILQEYEQTRKRVGLFDISHMGEFIIHGDAVASGLDRIVTQRLIDLPIKSCRYGGMLNEQGGVLDDLIVFRLEDEKWMVVVNAATTSKDAKQFQDQLVDDYKFDDVTFKTGKLDVQGPLARKVLERWVPDVSKLTYYTFDFFNFLGENVLISRTGYTGELGYEIYCPWDRTLDFWNELLTDPNVKPVGLGARDVLRLEVGYGLYGHELNEQSTALECGLKRFIDFDKDFIGKAALLKQIDDPNRGRLVGLTSSSRRSPRADQYIYSMNGENIGIVTSGSFSPYLEKGIGIAFLKSASFKAGDQVLFGNEKNKSEAVLSSKIFYKDGSLKS